MKVRDSQEKITYSFYTNKPFAIGCMRCNRGKWGKVPRRVGKVRKRQPPNALPSDNDFRTGLRRLVKIRGWQKRWHSLRVILKGESHNGRKWGVNVALWN